MTRLHAIALNTFREAVRDRVLLAVVLFASIVLFFGLTLAELSLDQQVRVVIDVGRATVSLFSVAVALFLGSSLLYKEMERKTLYVILPRPIRRWHFLVGKYLGIVCTAGVFIAIVGGVQLWVIALQLEAGLGALLAFPLLGLGALGLTLWRAHDRSLALIPWALAWLAGAAALLASTQASIAPLLAGFALSFSEVLVLAAVALFFSSFSTPFTTALLSLGVWLVGRSAHEMVTMRSALIPEGGRAVLAALAEIFPNFNLFVPSFGALGGLDGGVEAPLGYVITAFGYALAYGCGLLILASMIFRRRDLP